MKTELNSFLEHQKELLLKIDGAPRGNLYPFL